MASVSGLRKSALKNWYRLLPVLAVVSACGKAGAAAQMPGGMPPAQVGIVTVTPHNVPTPVEIAGQVEPYRRVEVRARVSGLILDRPFTEGSLVQAGQLLYQIDTVKYAAAYQSALASYENAQRSVDRMEPLLARHAVAQQDVDNARTALAAAKAMLDQTTKDLSDTRVRAEIAGRVGRTRLQTGAQVTGPADLLTTIDRVDPVYVTFHPSADQVQAWHGNAADLALIQPGSALKVRVVRADSSLLPTVGTLEFVAPSLDSTTATQEFRARFDNANGALVPGEFVRVRLDGFAQRAALTVPQRAVLQGLGSQYVYVVGNGDTVSVRNVTPGAWTGFEWIIDAGLSAGDRVIVDGTQKVRPGMVVQPVPSDSTGGAEAGSGRSGAAK